MMKQTRDGTSFAEMLPRRQSESHQRLISSSLIGPVCLDFSISQDQFIIEKVQSQKAEQKSDSNSSQVEKGKEWTHEEEEILVALHNQKGNRWVEIARQLRRSDNSVKNHYHSRLRKALRKINKCINDHLAVISRPLKASLLSRIVQTAEAYYIPSEKADALLAFKLKNDILSFADLSQQQVSQQQIVRVKILIEDITEFTKASKKDEKASASKKTASSKYKGKQILSLLQENNLNNLKRQQSQRIARQQEQAIARQTNSPLMSIERESVAYSPSFGVFSSVQPIYFYSQPVYPVCFQIVSHSAPSLFSGKPSSFTFYNGQNDGEKPCEQPTLTSMTCIQSESRLQGNLMANEDENQKAQIKFS